MKRWLDTITEGCEELNLTCKRQGEMEKYCPQQGLPERGDIVFVADALSPVNSKVTWIYIAPLWHSGMDHAVLPANNTMPAFTS